MTTRRHPVRSALAAFEEDEGVTTIEYTMVLGFMASLSIFVTLSLIRVLLSEVSALVVNIAIFLTGIPSS
jgi:Flp pilus assembly pilin Flp